MQLGMNALRLVCIVCSTHTPRLHKAHVTALSKGCSEDSVVSTLMGQYPITNSSLLDYPPPWTWLATSYNFVYTNTHLFLQPNTSPLPPSTLPPPPTSLQLHTCICTHIDRQTDRQTHIHTHKIPIHVYRPPQNDINHFCGKDCLIINYYAVAFIERILVTD